MAVPQTFLSLLRSMLQVPRKWLDPAVGCPPVWSAVLCGAGCGLLWGILARIWMRLISTQPEFSIAGTAAILLIASLFGAFVGLALAARRCAWRRWRHYLPRGLVVAFFLPFGIAGGTPLMLTVLVATLAITHSAAIGLWVVTLLAMLLVIATDIDVPAIAAAAAPTAAVALTVWKWFVRQSAGRLAHLDSWIEGLGRALLLLLAAGGVGVVARDILTSKPGLIGWVYVLCYLVLAYPLFLALRVGLEPAE